MQKESYSFDRLDMLWERYPQYRIMTPFSTLEALIRRQELDLQKKDLCRSNQVRLIEWPYSCEPTGENVQKMLRTSMV